MLTLQGLGRPGRPCTHRQKLWRERRTCEPVEQVLPKPAKACVSSRTSVHTHTHPPTQTHMLSSEFITWVCNTGRFLKNIRTIPWWFSSLLKTILSLNYSQVNAHIQYTQTETPGYWTWNELYVQHVIYDIGFTYRVLTEQLPIMQCWFEQCWHFSPEVRVQAS